MAVAALLGTACSEEKKREAARLEAQLNGDTLQMSDSQAAVVDTPADSIVIDSMTIQTLATTEETVTTVDSSFISHQTMIDSVAPGTEQLAAQTENQPTDSIIPDVNAVPKENGQRATSMPRFIADAYTVQVLSSTDQAYSQRVVDTFLIRGFESYLATVTRDGATYYRVRVGRFATSTEANMIAVEINRKYSLQSWVDKITK